MPKKLLEEVEKKENKTFLVTAHVHLEGDALGSELACRELLEALDKKVVVFNEDTPPEAYQFLPGLKSIRHVFNARPYDVAVFLDCSDASRIGRAHRAVMKSAGTVLNIDHHISNSRFGDVNWVNPKASCACEMVYELFGALGIAVTKSAALALYTGILCDTGSFKYATTSSATHRITSELLRYDLDVYGIQRRLYESMSAAYVRLLGRIIQGVKRSGDGRVAWIEIGAPLLKRHPALAEQTDEIIHYARAINGVEVALLFKETEAAREVRINFRSTGKTDVNRLAQLFGGGGHAMASGATLRGRFRDIVGRVVREARRQLK